jgi:hypothetical protein
MSWISLLSRLGTNGGFLETQRLNTENVCSQAMF